MAKLPKKPKMISVSKLLELDPKSKTDQSFLQFQDVILGIQNIMVQENISKNELARRMGISRQAVYDKFAGRNMTMKWIERACDALGVEMRIAFVAK